MTCLARQLLRFRLWRLERQIVLERFEPALSSKIDRTRAVLEAPVR